MKNIIFLRAAALIISFFLILCGCQEREVLKKEDEKIPVKISRIQLDEFQERISYVGDIKAEGEVLIYPKVTGKIIEKTEEEGSYVKKGQAIAYIDRDEVGLRFEKAPVESTLDGFVGRTLVDIGSSVNTQTPIALVVNIDKVKVDLDVPERYLPKISLGQEARISVDAYPDEQFLGKVTKISPVLDLNTRTSPIEIVLDNEGYRLKPGMFARVDLVIQKRENVPVVLKEAVMGKPPDSYIYIIKDNKAVLRKVETGIQQGPYYEIKEGLNEGDLVVVIGQQRLYDGVEVIIEEEKK